MICSSPYIMWNYVVEGSGAVMLVGHEDYLRGEKFNHSEELKEKYLHAVKR